MKLRTVGKLGVILSVILAEFNLQMQQNSD